MDIRRGDAILIARTGSFLGLWPLTQFYARRRCGHGATLLCIVWGLLGPYSNGCASAPPPPPLRQGVTVIGDGLWRDLEAAMWHAASQMELAVLSDIEIPSAEPARQRYILTSVNNERVTVEVVRRGEGDAAVVESITAAWAPFRDEAKERALVHHIQERLRRLEAGGGVAR